MGQMCSMMDHFYEVLRLGHQNLSEGGLMSITYKDKFAPHNNYIELYFSEKNSPTDHYSHILLYRSMKIQSCRLLS